MIINYKTEKTMKKNQYNNAVFIVDISSSKLDNAQYIMYFVNEQLALSNWKGTNHTKSQLGVLLGEIDVMDRTFRFYIAGSPTITRYNGEIIDKSSKLKQFLIQDREEELFYVNPAYIQVLDIENKEKFYGVYYSVADAIKGIEAELSVVS